MVPDDAGGRVESVSNHSCPGDGASAACGVRTNTWRENFKKTKIRLWGGVKGHIEVMNEEVREVFGTANRRTDNQDRI